MRHTIVATFHVEADSEEEALMTIETLCMNGVSSFPDESIIFDGADLPTLP